MKYKYKKITDNLISELAFKLILDSEEIEGFELGKNVISENTHLMNNICKDLTLQLIWDIASGSNSSLQTLRIFISICFLLRAML